MQLPNVFQTMDNETMLLILTTFLFSLLITRQLFLMQNKNKTFLD